MKLRFPDPVIEASFISAYPNDTRRQLQFAFVLATLMGLFYLPQDSLIAPDVGHYASLVRLSIVLPLGLLGIALTFLGRLQSLSQIYTAAIFAGMTLAMLAILLILESEAGFGLSSSTGLSNVTLAILFMYAVSTLLFLWASLVAVLLVAAYYFLTTSYTNVDVDYFINAEFSNVVFVLLIGGFIGAFREIYLRREFLAQLRLEERFRGLVEGSIQGVLVHKENRPLFVNQAFAELMGYPSINDILTAADIRDLYGERHRKLIERKDQDLLSGRVAPGHQEVMALRKDGTEIWLDCLASPVQWGDEVAIQHTVIDITQRKSAEAERSRLSQAIEQSPVEILITDAGGQIEYANANYLSRTRSTLADMSGEAIRTTKFPEMSDDDFADAMETVQNGGVWSGEVSSELPNGEHYWEHLIVSPIRTNGGAITNMMVAAQDISIRKVYEERLLHQAHYDHLTDLPNRLLALDRLVSAISRAKRQRFLVAVMFIDLDGFKKVNDMMGHNAGDRLLKQAARRLKSCGRDGDTIARLGGDEFAAILPDLRHISDAEKLARRIVKAFTAPFFIDDREVYATASVGISVFPNDGVDPVFLMRNADTAMYEAKQSGRNDFHFFTEKMNHNIQERIRLETRLRHALDRDELSLLYQPLVDPALGKVVGAEALLRWNGDEIGQISPSRFIPLAEDTGLIVPIGYWVLETACAWIRNWRERGIGPQFVAVNVSSRQFVDEEFVDRVLALLTANNLPPGSLELEVTESLLLEDETKALIALETLKQHGVLISIDDFGTGYSSLSYLKRYPFDTLKIDSSFVRDVVTDPEDRVLIQAIVAMAHSLSLKVVAEGVETAAQLNIVQSFACDLVQGYYFGAPMRSEAFEALINRSEHVKLMSV